MRHLLVCILSVLYIGAFGQNSIVDKIQKDEYGKGTVRIRQDAGITHMIGTRGDESSLSDSNRNQIRISGFRVQVFSGNNQQTSKSEAFSKEQQIKNRYSEYATYVTYKSPFWRLRVGDFRTYEEAYIVMQQLIKDFPNFGKEMHVVKEDVIISL